ncbi:MAG: type 1 glutamine amidotransferase [Planctomycetes bacterium]|nr:type 1 glutamine amidotransferase [Planctomycetota bacterium]
MRRRSRIALIVSAVGLGIPAVLVLVYLAARPAPPPGGPRIGLSMASGLVAQRPLYEDALARAGGRPVLVTPVSDAGELAALLDDVDALLLTGGGDIDPVLYGGDADDAWLVDRARDDFEIRLIRAAMERDMPILGICRGIQILNVAHGGTIRNLRDDPVLSATHGIDFDSFTAHQVEIVVGTRLAAALGAGARQVNSFHGQAVERVGAGLRVCAMADDAVIEAIERPDRAFVVGIQWHPEIQSLTDERGLELLRVLVQHARAYRAAHPVRRVGAAPAGE